MRKWTFLSVPRGGGKIHEFRLSPLVLIGIIAALALGYYGFFHTLRRLRRLEFKKQEIKNVLSENKSLETQLQLLNQKAGRLTEKIAALAQKERLLEELSHLPRAPRPLPENAADSAPRLSEAQLPLVRDSLKALESVYRDILRRIQSDSGTLEFVPTCRPTVPEAALTTRFGLQRDPFSGKMKPHRGVDFAFDPGTPVFAAATGTVIFAGKEKGFGNVVRLAHGQEWETLYAHLDAVGVFRGQRVKKGQRIGTLGNSGRSIGPHLHFEVTRNGAYLDPELLF